MNTMSREVSNAEVFGMIQGLLEGWGIEWSRWTDNWDQLESITLAQANRLHELLDLLDAAWIIRTMNSGYTSDIKLLTMLAKV